MINPRSIFRRLFHKKVVTIPPVQLQTSSIIHDLSNPLTILNLSLEELKSNARIRDLRDRKHIDTAFRASKKMSLFLSTVKKQLSEKKVATCFDARIEIQSSIKLLRNISKKMQVRIKYRSPRAVFICGDEVKFFRVISNIISNAIESYASFPIEKNKLVIVRTISDKKNITISIRDFGCGIPKHLHKSIFEPFYTTKQRHEGAGGLGLSIVKNIVENDFKGKIKLESFPARGSTFRIIIPNYLPAFEKRSFGFNLSTVNK